ncbi:flagellar basal body P-ring formation chaperone FlgA [Gallionella capsiferriformans]|uniref:Flagella basal body P-ring formation protein FlgA n=1 Tax=Gallionella capsiferriformans (strain ES-2) TaxID=395494 RepID=D9SEX5_GALCS|nr:flagellar basal body P-ring formation chaperone FlgA [Gallionella capsiferriformans]ADL55072.1 flagella basal body P-ring formation protein FlgA [Gallionella capsiferriformans ES-2]
MKTLLLIIYLLCYSLASAAPQQDHAQLRAAAAALVQQQTAYLPGKVTFMVDEIDKRISLRPCSKIEAFLPPGTQLTGRVSIGVRCTETGGWSTLIPVQIKITRELLVSAHALTLGQIVRETDLARLQTETTLNSGITDASLIVGKVLRYSVAAGYILREDMLRPPYSIKQGQTVNLSIQANGFTLSSSGVALNNASEGETVQARTSSGRVISGTASADGVILINP